MSVWSYAQNGQSRGPVETSVLHGLLREGALAPETLVWKEGMASWVPANTIPELNVGPAPSAPPKLEMPPSLPRAEGPDAPDAADVEKNKVFAVLAYIGLLFLVPLLAAPQSKFARYHTNQGIVLFVSSIVLFFGAALLYALPLIGCLATPLPFGVAVGSFVLMVMGIVNAATGKCKPLPWIGHFQLLK